MRKVAVIDVHREEEMRVTAGRLSCLAAGAELSKKTKTGPTSRPDHFSFMFSKWKLDLQGWRDWQGPAGSVICKYWFYHFMSGLWLCPSEPWPGQVYNDQTVLCVVSYQFIIISRPATIKQFSWVQLEPWSLHSAECSKESSSPILRTPL